MLDKIKTMLGQITPGPWKVYESTVGRHTEQRVGTEYDHPQLHGPVGIINHAYGLDGEFIHIKDTDAEFIAAAPEMLQWALQEIERITDLYEECRADAITMHEALEWYADYRLSDGGCRAREALKCSL